MDGNRRFAKDNGFHSSLGHYMGSKALIKIIEICISLNIKILSVFSLSLFNYNRSPQEIYFLFYLNLHCLSNEDFFKIRIKIIGNLSYINDFYRKIINDIEQKTREFDNLILNIFFSYTSRNEMSLCKFMPNLYFDTYKKLLEEQNICYSSYSLKNYINENNCEHSENIIKNEHIESTSNCEIKCFCGKYSFLNEEQLNIYNYHKKLLTSDLPPPNILIRTSGEKRLSDFMLYQVSEFTEIYFINDHWPTFNFLHFIYIILHYTFFQTIEWEFSYSNPCPH